MVVGNGGKNWEMKHVIDRGEYDQYTNSLKGPEQSQSAMVALQ